MKWACRCEGRGVGRSDEMKRRGEGKGGNLHASKDLPGVCVCVCLTTQL